MAEPQTGRWQFSLATLMTLLIVCPPLIGMAIKWLDLSLLVIVVVKMSLGGGLLVAYILLTRKNRELMELLLRVGVACGSMGAGGWLILAIVTENSTARLVGISTGIILGMAYGLICWFNMHKDGPPQYNEGR